MDREKAIEYLERKGKLEDKTFSKKEETDIDKVMTEGKIYGDPYVEVEF